MLKRPTIVGSTGCAAITARNIGGGCSRASSVSQRISHAEVARGRECVEHALEVRGVSLRFGGVRALTDVSFGVNEGELFSIIGPNGAGKTSIINCISGRYRPTEGLLFYHGRDITALNPNARPSLGIGRTFQNLALFQHMSVLDNIMVGRHHLLKNNFITGSLYWLTGARREELEHRRKVEEIIDFLDLQSVRKATAGTLPYGLRKRVELARAMALEPRLILLDEPMAGMNFEEKEDMARYIVDLNEEFGMTVVMIEHDMGVVMDISHRVMVLDFGRKIAEGDPAAVLADPHVRRAYLGEEDEVLVDPDDAPPAQESAAGWITQAASRRPTPIRRCSGSMRRSTATRSRCAKRISGCGARSPGTPTRRGCATSRSA